MILLESAFVFFVPPGRLGVPSDDWDDDVGSFDPSGWLFSAARFFPNRYVYEVHFGDERKISQQAREVIKGLVPSGSVRISGQGFLENIFRRPPRLLLINNGLVAASEFGDLRLQS